MGENFATPLPCQKLCLLENCCVMVPQLREQYNQAFTSAKYQAFLDHLAQLWHHKPRFKVCETPVFVPPPLQRKLFEACEEIIDVLVRPDFKDLTQGALKPEYAVPGEDDHTLFLQMDFGITRNACGALEPRLIEIQGFPSLYVYQDYLARTYRRFFPIPDGYTHLFRGLDSASYLEQLRRLIVGDEDPKQVVLLDVKPFEQPTLIDLLATRAALGTPICCVSDIIVRGDKLYYRDEAGKTVRIKKIYNRVIFDELIHRSDLPRQFRFTRAYEVEYVGHPNWFFRISKYTLPLLRHCRYVPDSWFLDQVETLPDDLHNYVLKPLFSFSGSGVMIHFNRYDVEAIRDKSAYLLQRKVRYEPVIDTPDEPAKVEIRMLMLWPPKQPRPFIINNLARLSKGLMIGVRHNKDKTWVGGSVGFFPVNEE